MFKHGMSNGFNALLDHFAWIGCCDVRNFVDAGTLFVCWYKGGLNELDR